MGAYDCLICGKATNEMGPVRLCKKHARVVDHEIPATFAPEDCYANVAIREPAWVKKPLAQGLVGHRHKQSCRTDPESCGDPEAPYERGAK